MPKILNYAESLLRSLLASEEMTEANDLELEMYTNIRMHYLSELIHQLMTLLTSRGYDVSILIVALESNLERWRPKPPPTDKPPTGLRRFLKR